MGNSSWGASVGWQSLHGGSYMVRGRGVVIKDKDRGYKFVVMAVMGL